MYALDNGVNRGGTIATANTSQQVAPAKENRMGLTFQNTSDTEMWLTETSLTAAVGVGYKVAPGAGVNVNTTDAVNVFCTAAGKTFAATEF